MLRLAIACAACLLASTPLARGDGNPLAAGPQGAGPQGAAPLADAAGRIAFPAFLKPGMRIVQYASDATIPNVRQVYVPDDNGGWTLNGQRVSLQNNPGPAGAGLRVFDVLAIDGDKVALAVNLYVLDVQTGNCTNASQPFTLIGDVNKIEDFWVHPAKLAQMQPMQQGGVTVMRMQYPLDGKTYNAVSISTVTDSGATRYVYDLETGLCIVFSASTTGKKAWVPAGDGKATREVTGTGLVYNKMVGVREVSLPWSGQSFPREAFAEGAASRWSGMITTDVHAGAPVQQPFGATMRVDKRIDDATVWLALALRPDVPPVKHAVSARGVGTLWVDPNTLARLQPGQVLDEDKLMRTTISYAGNQNGLLCVVEKRPTEATVYGYDPRTGHLVATEMVTNNGIATVTTSLRRE